MQTRSPLRRAPRSFPDAHHLPDMSDSRNRSPCPTDILPLPSLSNERSSSVVLHHAQGSIPPAKESPGSSCPFVLLLAVEEKTRAPEFRVLAQSEVPAAIHSRHQVPKTWSSGRESAKSSARAHSKSLPEYDAPWETPTMSNAFQC